MGAQVDLLLYIQTEVGVGAGCYIWDAVFCHLVVGFGVVIAELVNLSTGLKAKILEEVEVRLLADDGDVALLGIHDHVMGVVLFIDGHGDGVWVGCYLDYGVADTAVHFPLMDSRTYEEAVRKLVHCFGVHFSFFHHHFPLCIGIF